MNTKVLGAILLGIVLVIVAAIGGYWYGQRGDDRRYVTDFASCEAAGYPIMNLVIFKDRSEN